MAADKLTRTGAAPGVRYGSGAPARTAAFGEARAVGAETAYVTRDGAAQFDKRAGILGCDIALIRVDLEFGLGSRLKNFFKSGAI